MLVLLAVAGLAAAQEAEPGFKVYRYSHPTFGYSIEVPEAWQVEYQEHRAWLKRSLGTGRLFVQNPHVDLQTQGGAVRAVLLVELLPDMGAGVEQYGRIYQQMERRDSGNYQEVRTQLSPGPEGQRFLLEEEFEVDSVSVHRLNVFVAYRAAVFQLSATAAASVWQKYRPLFETSLRSFRVTAAEER